MRKYFFIAVCFWMLLISCSQPSIYTGIKYPKTKSVDIFYSASEVKRPYKVMGRIIAHKYSREILRQNLAHDARRAGADAVIIIGDDSSVTGKPNRITADAIKYDR